MMEFVLDTAFPLVEAVSKTYWTSEKNNLELIVMTDSLEVLVMQDIQ